MARVYSALFFSLMFSLIMSFYTPKILGVEQFSYWQVFLFYAGYTGLFHFGLNDGIYLRYGAAKLSNADKSIISGQLWILVLYLIGLFSIIVSIVWIVNPNIPQLKSILLLVSLYTIVYNASNYCGYLLQALNRFKLYSYAVIADKIFLITSIILLGFLHADSYGTVAILYIIGAVITFAIIIIRCKDIFLNEFKFTKELFVSIWINIKAGINLMLSNIASTVIIGICRFLISITYPIVTFGYVSFSFTLCNFILVFISQIGIAIYPILKAKDESFHTHFFPQIRDLISYILSFSLIAYPLLSLIVNSYLPKYITSLEYFAYLLPICIFEAKISILYNTYMKVLRHEKIMLVINLISSLFSIILSLIAICLIDNIQLSLLGVALAIILKSTMYDWYLSKQFACRFTIINSDIVLTFVYLALIFMNLPTLVAVVSIVTINSIICFVKKDDIIKYLKLFKQ